MFLSASCRGSHPRFMRLSRSETTLGASTGFTARWAADEWKAGTDAVTIKWSSQRMAVNLLVGLVAACLVTLDPVLALGPGSQRASVTEGGRLVSRGEYAAAIRGLARAVALWPRDARAHYYLGLAYGGIGQREASMSHLREAVRLDPGDPRFHDALGRAYRKAGASACALHEFQEAVRRGPGTPGYAVDLAGLFMDEGRWVEAAALLHQVEREAPASPGIRLLRADVLRHAGNTGGMEHEYRAVVRLADGTALGELARQELRADAPETRPSPAWRSGASPSTLAPQ
jgi:tetratricopeptide (TPR) repeat protein